MFQTKISDSQNRPISQPGKGADGLKPHGFHPTISRGWWLLKTRDFPLNKNRWDWNCDLYHLHIYIYIEMFFSFWVLVLLKKWHSLICGKVYIDGIDKQSGWSTQLQQWYESNWSCQVGFIFLKGWKQKKVRQHETMSNGWEREMCICFFHIFLCWYVKDLLDMINLWHPAIIMIEQRICCSYLSAVHQQYYLLNTHSDSVYSWSFLITSQISFHITSSKPKNAPIVSLKKTHGSPCLYCIHSQGA